MPLSPLHSAEWLQFTSAPPVLPGAFKWGGKLYTRSASLVFTAAGQGTAKLFRLPPGKVRVMSYLSRVSCPAGAATCDIDLGYAAYVDEAGVPVAGNAAAFGAALDAAAPISSAWPLPAAGYLDLNSQKGIDIEARVFTANSPAAGELFVLCAYQLGG